MRHLSMMALMAALLSACSSGELGRPDDALIRGVNYVGVTVSDLDRSSHFYRDVANLEAVEEGTLHNHAVINALTGRSGVEVSTQLMRSSNAQLRLMDFAERSPEAKTTPSMDVFGPGIAHLCFQVNQTTKTYERFLAAGGTHIGDPAMQQNIQGRPVYYAYARDLDKAIVEIEHVDVAALDRPAPENDYRIRHISLSTPDIDRAASFYSALLQEENPRRVGSWYFSVKGDMVNKVTGEEGAKLHFAWFQIRNLELEIIEYKTHPSETPETPRPLDANGYNMIVFDVTDIQAVKERLLAAGGSVTLETQPMDGGQILFGRDPDGNLLGFQTLADESAFSSQNFSGNGT